MINSNDLDLQLERPSGATLWFSRLLLVAGSVAIVWALYLWVDGQIYQTSERRRFEEIAGSQGLSSAAAVKEAPPLPEEPAPMAPQPVIQPLIPGDLATKSPSTGSVLGEMQIARIGLSVMVAEGDSPAVLRRAAAHLKGTALPGQAGNVAIAAHRDTLFRSLRNIRANDTITFATLGGTYKYQVELVEIVAPENTEVLAASPEPTLTLITCYPFYYIGPAPKRFVVRARQSSPLP